MPTEKQLNKLGIPTLSNLQPIYLIAGIGLLYVLLKK